MLISSASRTIPDASPGAGFTRFDAVIVALLTAAAVALRVFGLGEWPLDGDEYFTFDEAEERAGNLIRNPAYYQLALLSFAAFGHTELAARIPAFLLGAATIPVMYLAWRRELGRPAAILAAMLLATCSWHLFFSQYARFYSGVVLFALLSYRSYLTALQRDNLWWLAAAIATGLVATLFHLTAGLVLAAAAVSSFAVALLRWRHGQVLGRMLLVHLGLSAVAGIAALPVALSIFGSWRAEGETWGYGPALTLLQLPKYFGLLICVAAAFGLLSWWPKDREFCAAVGVLAGLPVGLIVVASAFMAVRPDYVIYVLPLVLLLAASFAQQCLGGRSVSMPFAGVAAILLASQVPETVSHYTAKRSLDIRAAIAAVEARYEPGDKILTFVQGFGRYASRPYEIEPYPGSAYDDSVDWDAILSAYVERDETLWILLPINRAPLAAGLERWLTEHGHLAWREYVRRFDYTFDGYQLFRASASADGAAMRSQN